MTRGIYHCGEESIASAYLAGLHGPDLVRAGVARRADGAVGLPRQRVVAVAAGHLQVHVRVRAHVAGRAGGAGGGLPHDAVGPGGAGVVAVRGLGVRAGHAGGAVGAVGGAGAGEGAGPAQRPQRVGGGAGVPGGARVADLVPSGGVPPEGAGEGVGLVVAGVPLRADGAGGGVPVGVVAGRARLRGVGGGGAHGPGRAAVAVVAALHGVLTCGRGGPTVKAFLSSGGEGGSQMRRRHPRPLTSTHGGLKRQPPTHRLTNTRENIRGKVCGAFSAGNIALPLKTTSCPPPPLGGCPIRRRHPPF